MGSTKLVRSSSPPSVLGKRDAAGQLVYQHAFHQQDRNSEMNINDVANLNIMLPSPRVNPTRKGCDLASRNPNVMKESSLQQSCLPVDLGAGSDFLFSSGGYICSLEENRSAEMDAGMESDNGNLDELYVDTDIYKEGGYPCPRDIEENPDAKNDVRLMIDIDNVDSVQLVSESCREWGHTFWGGKNPCAKNNVGLGIDGDNLNSLHILSDKRAQGPTGYCQGTNRRTENTLEKLQTRGATSTFQEKSSNDSEPEYVDTNVIVPVTVQPAPNLHKASNIIDTMQAADDLISTPSHEDSTHDMWKGGVFNSRDAFKSTLAKFAMFKNFCLKPLRTNIFEATTRCNHSTCPWRIHASIVDSGLHFQVRTYNPDHNCTGSVNGTNYPQATSGLIVDFIRDRLRVHQDYKPKEIMLDFQREFDGQISYRKAHIAKEIAMKHIRGSFEDSYKILFDYRLELKRTNPGTVDNLWTDDHSFQRYYVCFGGCARSFK